MAKCVYFAAYLRKEYKICKVDKIFTGIGHTA